MEFYTLQDFLTFSKGVTYVLMGTFLVGFLGFYLYLNGYEDEKKKKVD